MRLIVIMLVSVALAAPANAQEQASRPSVAPEDMHWVAPGLAGFTDEVLFGDVWKRPDLTPRDRSIVTLSALIAGGHTAQLTGHLNRALDNGVKPAEIGGIITHLAFYAGWPNSVSALSPTRKVLEARGVRQSEMQVSPNQPSGVTAGSRIWRKGSGPITAGPAANFTGAVRVLAPYRGSGGSRLSGATVMFQPGARSAWHRHPLGQALIVTEGCGWTQRGGGPIEKICAGDVAWIGPGEKHWHGATLTTAMTHVTASESVDGQNVEWLEKVSDDEYARGPR